MIQLNQARPCKNPKCDREVSFSVEYCCRMCHQSHELELPTRHSDRCTQRQVERLEKSGKKLF